MGNVCVCGQQMDLSDGDEPEATRAEISEELETALRVAASGGQLDVVRALIQAGCDVNAADGWRGETALHLAASGGHLDMVQALIQAGCDMNAVDRDGRTALHKAARGGHLDVVQALIEAGCDVNAVDRWAHETALHKAARGGRLDMVRVLIQAGCDVNAAAGEHGYTALHEAARGGHPDVVQVLIQTGFDVNAAGGWDRKTALHMAASGGHLDMVRVLIQAGCDVNAAGGWDRKTALHLAARCGHLDMVRVLIQAGCDVNAAGGWDGRTALQLAARRGHLDMVRVLIQAGCDVNVAVGRYGYTALHVAAEGGHLDIVQALIQAGCDVDAVDDVYYNTALHLAAEGGHLDVVRVLIQAGCDVNAVDEWDGRTALHEAARGGHLDMVRVLIQAGCDVNVAVGRSGYTALHEAARGGHLDVVQALIQAGCDMNAVDRFGTVPLQLAVYGGYDDVIETLIKHGASLSHLGKDKASNLINRGLITRAQLEQSDLRALGELPEGYVTSTKEFTEKIALKVVLIGQKEAGKTSLLRTVKNQESALTPDGPAGRTIGVELTVLDVDVHPEIRCYMYDFGGQEEYYPLHQAVITPHSMFVLLVDLFSFWGNIDNEEFFNANIGHFYYTFYQRVRSPVLQVVGTKADKLKDTEIGMCKEKILQKLKELEETEKDLLKQRAKDLKDANYKFRGLSQSDKESKLQEVEQLLKDRPKLPSDVIVVSSKDFTGIKDWTNDIAAKVFENKDSFPAISIPNTWLEISNHLSANKENSAQSVTLEEFDKTCRRFNVTTKKERDGVVHHLRIIGQILFYENHRKLKDVIFINPEAVLNCLSSVFNHEHMTGEYWRKMKMTRPTRDQHENLYWEHGRISSTVMMSFLQEKGVEGEYENIVELMQKINLCYKIINENSTSDLVDEETYIIPSLLKNQASSEKSKMWPETKKEEENDLMVTLSLVTAMEPIGLFEKITTRINSHLDKRSDVAKRTVAQYNRYGDTFRFETQKQDEMSLRVRHGLGRHKTAADFLKVIITLTIDILSNYPSVLFDFFCNPCLSSGTSGCKLLAAEISIYADIQGHRMHTCDKCNRRYELMTGFPVATGSLGPLFECLRTETISCIGPQWRFLARELLTSIDQADRIINEIASDHREDSLKEQACQMFQKWQDIGDPYFGHRDTLDACYYRLLASLSHLDRNQIIKTDRYKIGLQDVRYAEDVVLYCEIEEDDATVKGLTKRMLLLTSKETGDKQWKHLYRYLDRSISNEQKANIEEIEADVKGLREKVHVMLTRWIGDKGEAATITALIAALESDSVKRKDIAEKLEKQYERYARYKADDWKFDRLVL